MKTNKILFLVGAICIILSYFVAAIDRNNILIILASALTFLVGGWALIGAYVLRDVE